MSSPGMSNPGTPTPFDLTELLSSRRGENYDLQGRYVNHQVPRVLHAIGFDKIYETAQGCYLTDS